MAYHEENESGRIRIGRGVIENVCARVIDGFDGRVLVSDPRGRLRRGKQQAPEDERGFARARLREGKLDVKLYLIAQFGTSLRESAKALAEQLREEFPRQIGIEIRLVTMVFVGILSEKLSRRKVIFVDDGKTCEAREDT